MKMLQIQAIKPLGGDYIFRGSLEVHVELDHYPKVNEEASVLIETSFWHCLSDSIINFLTDSLIAHGVDSLGLYSVLVFSEDGEKSDGILVDDSVQYKYISVVSILDTVRFHFVIKPLRVGRFWVGAGVGYGPKLRVSAEADSVGRHLGGVLFDTGGMTLCIEEGRSYDCPYNSSEGSDPCDVMY